MNVLASTYDFYKSRTKSFWLFEASIWLHLFSTSFVSIFIPILLYEDGFSLQHILLFYFLLHIVNIPANFLAGNLVYRFGSKFVVIVATILYLLFFLSFSFLGGGSWVIFLTMAVLAAFYDAFYYVSSLNIFMKASKKPENSGKNTGILNIVSSFAYLAGPFVGSSILLFSKNPNSILYAVIFFLFLSIIPLFRMSDLGIRNRHKPLSVKRFFSSDRERKNHFSLMFYKVGEGVEYILFPLYLFLIIGTLESVALLAVILPIFSFFFTYLSGNIDRTKRRFFIQLGSVLLFLVWLSRITFDDNFVLYGSSIILSFLVIFTRIPIDANIFQTGNEESHTLSSSMYKNLSAMVSKGLLFGVLYALTFFMNDNGVFIAAFAISAVTSLAVMLINKFYWQKIEKASL